MDINGFVLKKWDIPQVMAIEMPKNIKKTASIKTKQEWVRISWL